MNYKKTHVAAIQELATGVKKQTKGIQELIGIIKVNLGTIQITTPKMRKEMKPSYRMVIHTGLELNPPISFLARFWV